MKLKPRNEMRLVAIVMVAMAVFLLAFFVWFIAIYQKFKGISWERLFRTEVQHHYFMEFLGALMLVIPCLAMVFGCGSWIIFKHLNRISDDIPPA
jgi:uncharacterized membrane protein